MNNLWRGKTIIFLLSGLMIGLSLGIVVFFSGGSGRQIRDVQPFPQIGKEFPAFELETLDGTKLGLEYFSNRPVIINFWATWCEPCKEEMPLLEAYANRYSEISIIGINYDEPLQIARRFVEDQKITFYILMDPGGKISNQFKVFGFPTTFFIDAEGILQSNHIGQLNEQLMDLYLEQIGIKP